METTAIKANGHSDEEGFKNPLMELALKNPGKHTGKSRRNAHRAPQQPRQPKLVAFAATAVASNPASVNETLAAQAVETELKPRTPAEILAAVRAKRTASLAVKVEVDPQVTEALALLSEERIAPQANRATAEAQRNELRDSLGKGLIPDATLRSGIAQVERLIRQIDTDLAQIEVDARAISEENSVGMMLAILEQAKLRKSTRQLLEGLTDQASQITIGTLCEKAFRGLGVIKHGAEGNDSFFWSNAHWVSNLPNEPDAFGLISRMRKAIALWQERDRVRRAEEQKHFIGPEEFQQIKATSLSLSELVAGHNGHALVPISNERGEAMGHALVETDGDQLVARRCSDRRLIQWVIANRNGELRSEVLLKMGKDDQWLHGHPGVRRSFDAQWAKEKPIREYLEKADRRDEELEKFVANKKAHVFGQSLDALLKPTSAGTGFYPVVFDWKVEPGRKGRSAPCGIVLQKKGAKVAVMYKTSAMTPIDDLMDKFVPVSDLPISLKTILRAACQLEGIEEVPEALQ